MQRMVKYRVIRTCHWNYGYWEEGRIVELPEGTDGHGLLFPEPNNHFQRLDDDGKDVVAVTKIHTREPGSTFSEMNKTLEDIPNTGMMHDPKKHSPEKRPVGRPPKIAA